tara:strand:- start:341 stop:829 length:489 start_codon:yes stop_codon:yes gene_type:complete
MTWIVVQTKSNNEIKASINLKRQGYEVFFPKIKKSIFSFNKLKDKLRPLFPGYLFINLKENQSWMRINSTFGVKSILKLGEKNYILPNQILKDIKSRCNKEEICKLDQPKKGQEISIIKSNVPNLKAIFIEYIDEKRSFVFIDLLMRKIKTKVWNSNIQLLN